MVEVTEGIQTDFFSQRIVSGAGGGDSFRGWLHYYKRACCAGRNQCKMTMADKTGYEAKVIGGDAPAADIAVLKVEAKGLPAVTVGNSDNLIVGEFALAIGNPLGTLGGTVTDGIISALNRDICGRAHHEFNANNAAVSRKLGRRPL